MNAATLGRLTGLFLLSRLVVLVVASLSHTAIVQGPLSLQSRTWVERLANWDSAWYLSIVRDGYFYHPDAQSSVGFYPLYPLLIRGLAQLGVDDVLAGYAISMTALYLACLLLWRLAARETRSASVAERTVLFLLICPATMWFGFIYTESLYLLTVIGCMFAARHGRWLVAGIWGLAAALTRTPGVFLSGFLFLEAVQQWWERRRLRAAGGSASDAGSDVSWWRKWRARAVLGMCGPIAGQGIFLVFLQMRFGDWRAQQKTMAAGWNGVPHWPWEALVDQWRTVPAIFTSVSMPLLVIVVLLALVGLFTLKRVGYAALAIALATLYLSTTPGDASTRYLCTTVPTYMVLAQLAGRSKLLETAIIVFSVAVMAVLTALRANGYRII